MSELLFIRCEAGAAAAAGDWGRAALARAGLAEGAATRAADRLAEGVRAAAAALPERPEAMLALRRRDAGLEFELLADGAPPPCGLRSAVCASGARLWPVIERRVAGDGALRLAMTAEA